MSKLKDELDQGKVFKYKDLDETMDIEVSKSKLEGNYVIWQNDLSEKGSKEKKHSTFNAFKKEFESLCKEFDLELYE